VPSNLPTKSFVSAGRVVECRHEDVKSSRAATIVRVPTSPSSARSGPPRIASPPQYASSGSQPAASSSNVDRPRTKQIWSSRPTRLLIAYTFLVSACALEQRTGATRALRRRRFDRGLALDRAAVALPRGYPRVRAEASGCSGTPAAFVGRTSRAAHPLPLAAGLRGRRCTPSNLPTGLERQPSGGCLQATSQVDRCR